VVREQAPPLAGWSERAPAIAMACLLGAVTVADAADAADAAPRTHVVVIDGMRFVPESLSVRRGDRVVWRNRDLVPHTATASKVFDSGSIAASASWSTVLRQRGTLAYVCSVHPTMTGTLKVE